MNIPCEVILDLIPLVRDGASSEEAKRMVEDHVAQCAPCREEYESYSPIKQNAITIEDKKILRAIKGSILTAKFAVMGIILFLCMMVLPFNDRFVYYNYFLMLGAGVLGYFAFHSRRWILPIAAFAFTFLWRIIEVLLQRYPAYAPVERIVTEVVTQQLLQSALYAAITAGGLLVGFLFRYAFAPAASRNRKEGL